jgi:hypothetical protein
MVTPVAHPDFDEDELAPREGGARLRSMPATEVVPTRPEWIIEGWFLRRALNLIVGRQGAGKTTFAAWVLNIATTLNAFPGDEERKPLRAAFMSLEEPDDRIVARLKAAGADLELVVILGEVEDVDEEGRRFLRRWQIPKDIATLGQAITELRLDVVVIDGLGFSIAGDSHNYSVVGSALSALAAEADRTQACIIGLTHPPKGASDPVTAAIGSTAWTSIPRISIVLGVDPDDETRRVVRVAKTNYREPASGLSFTLGSDEEFEVGYVANVTASDVTAEQITSAPATADERGDRDDARTFVREFLADGPQPSEDMLRAAEANGVSRRTLFRARKDEGVVSTREADPKSGRMTRWVVSLPETTVPPSPQMDTGDSGHTGIDQAFEFPGGPECQPLESGTVGGRPFYSRTEW